MSGDHWSWTLLKFQDMTGGHAAQMQKTAEAIMHNSKKKAMLVEICLLQKPIIRYLFINTMYQCSS